MKKYLSLTVLTLGVLTIGALVSSCGEKGKNKIQGNDAQEQAVTTGDTLAVNTTTSVINWKGFKPGGAHYGTIALKNGDIIVGANDNVSGSFVVDMNSINAQDLDAGSGKDKLEGHLKSVDFFDVAQYPESKFTITKVEPVTGNDTITHLISGNLKLKDTEKNISFGAKVSKEGNGFKAVSVPFTIDRTQWNVTYASKSIFAELKDNVVNDDIELQITIETQPVSK